MGGGGKGAGQVRKKSGGFSFPQFPGELIHTGYCFNIISKIVNTVLLKNYSKKTSLPQHFSKKLFYFVM